MTAICTKPIMFQLPTAWVDNSPDALRDIALRYCIKHQNTFCKYNKITEEYDELLDYVSLPFGICERLLNLGKTEMSEDRFIRFTRLFNDPVRTHLRQLDLSDSVIEDHNLEILTRHYIAELNISNCERLTHTSLPYIAKLRNSLVYLNVGNSIQIFPTEEDNNSQLARKSKDTSMISSQELDPHNEASNNVDVFSELCLPFLRKLVINGLKTKHYLGDILKSTEHLTYLDLSNCDFDGNALECLSAQKQLTSLILCDVMGFEEYVPAICKLKTLRHLDISHPSQITVMCHQNPDKALTSIVESLENLVSLDISWTNLAGGPPAKRISPESDVTEEGENSTDIPGLASRVNKPLEFLGLLYTAHDASSRQHIPAKKIAGDTTEEQLLIAGQAHCARYQNISLIMCKLMVKLRNYTCTNVRLALDVVMEAMRLHPKRESIQVSGGISLYCIVKEDSDLFNPKMRQKIIKVLVDAMCSYASSDMLLEYGILALSHFKTPELFYFEYEKLANLLLLIADPNKRREDEYPAERGLCILNRLVCQVDEFFKKLLGDKGAMTVMLQLIEQRLESNVCDQGMVYAWTIMWNCTDETPINSVRFLDGGGLDLFSRCLQAFPDKAHLLQNMTGVLGNVAEVEELRPHLMKDEYLSAFSDLLDSESIDLDTSYNAAGIISHIATDGEEAWSRHNIVSVKRKAILTKMVNAIEKWDFDTNTFITYRSFGPMLKLLNIDHIPEVQHWAVWAIAHTIRVRPDRYCSLLKEEGGIDILQKLLMKSGDSRISELAETTIKLCERYERGVTED